MDFLRRLQTFSKNTDSYENVLGMRTALKNMASISPLSLKEAEAVAAIDISIQEVARRIIPSVNGSSYRNGGFNPIANAALFYTDLKEEQRFAPMASYNYVKLPTWVRCVLGILSDALLGGFGGARIGAAIGGPVGAVVAGIMGVIGGVFRGVTDFC